MPYLRNDAWPSASSQEVYPHRSALGCRTQIGGPYGVNMAEVSPEALGQLVEGLHQAGAQLVNLQVGHDRAMATPLASRFADALPETADFSATAALVRQLDLVICVDTAIAHLAGALGHPAWILLPFAADPRWLRDRSDSPWYQVCAYSASRRLAPGTRNRRTHQLPISGARALLSWHRSAHQLRLSASCS